jgi:hypothetical protein
MKRER